ncbi:hypothetical protein B0T10DRAFT_261967 [Thelonectria olida]|uniref:F-box domain-containing protein n=1 Tax=Thelonectria olida TaxID=1576542 RepID=A0A9P8VR63_9HYPO|nr:hypothetical protein B0T10DRAFT_261967 [Thelonectria olida]
MIVLPRQPPGPEIKLPPIYPTPLYSPVQPITLLSPGTFSSSSSYSLPGQCLPSMPSLLERLPNVLQRLVFSNLDYQSLIFLSTVNRHFRRTINPQEMADPLDKFQFVMRAARDFPQHRPIEKGQDHQPGNFECYMCYRVRKPEHFDVLQPQSAYVDVHGRVVSGRELGPGHRLVPLRRFCIECGIKCGLHVPFGRLATRTGLDLWVCRCRMVWQKPSCVKCPDCGGSCPVRPKRKW